MKGFMPAKNLMPDGQPIPAVAIMAGLAVLFGIAVFSYGFWLAWHPLGYIMGGLSILMVGVLLGRRARYSARRQA